MGKSTRKAAKSPKAPVATPNAAGQQFWLMKSEVDVYSIADLQRDRQTTWEGVRNYQARNYLRQQAVGDLVLFYQTNAEPSGIAGLAKVCRAAYPDPTALEPSSPYFDPKSTLAEPIWYRVDLAFVLAFERVLPLAALRADTSLEGLLLFRQMRLSVMPVSPEHVIRVLYAWYRNGSVARESGET